MNNLAEPAKGSKPLIKSMKKVGPLPLSQASGFRSLENRRVNRPRVIRTPASSRRSRRAARASLSFSPSPRSSSSSTLPTTPSTSTRKSPWMSRFSRLSLTLSSLLTTSPSRPASRPSSFGKYLPPLSGPVASPSRVLLRAYLPLAKDTCAHGMVQAVPPRALASVAFQIVSFYYNSTRLIASYLDCNDRFEFYSNCPLN